MARRGALGDPPVADVWASLPIPELPDPAADQAARWELEAAVRFLHSRHRLARHCERPDHLAEMAREADREAEAQAEALEAVIRTMLRAMHVPEEVERVGLEVAAAELRKLAERDDR